MEDEIKVGDYVRINKDHRIIALGIAKVVKTINESIHIKNKFELPITIDKNSIANHRKNIIDLIEVKDVIHYRIDHISTTLETKGYIEGITEITDEEMLESIKENKDYHILEVLTKEQWNQTAYKVIQEEN